MSTIQHTTCLSISRDLGQKMRSDGHAESVTMLLS